MVLTPTPAPQRDPAAAPAPPPGRSHRHLLYDLWTAPGAPVLDAVAWRRILSAAAAAGGATVLGETFHQFQPQGVTGILLLAESHLSVHTWPEHEHAAVDLFTCGPMDADTVIAYIRQALQPVRERLQIVIRGLDD